MSKQKDPRLVDAGKRGAIRRWRVVRLDHLPPEQARLVREFVRIASSADKHDDKAA